MSCKYHQVNEHFVGIKHSCEIRISDELQGVNDENEASGKY